MSTNSLFTPSFNTLPDVIPLFPLAGALVMPGTQLPLNIFEPRYLSMVNDVLGNHRIIGMVQPGEGDSVCSTGCAARITSFNETEDGRFIILLSGLCRFDVVEEQACDADYRLFRVDWSRFESDYQLEQDFNDAGLRQRLIGEISQFAGKEELGLDMEKLDKLDDLTLVNVLTCGLGFDLNDSQGLIECVGLDERADLLGGLLKMRQHAGIESSVTAH